MKAKKTMPSVEVRCPSCGVLADSPCEAEMITCSLWIVPCQNCGGMYAMSFEIETDNPDPYGTGGMWRIRLFT